MSSILKLDISGNPIRWIGWQDAVSLYAEDAIAWDYGDDLQRYRGGISRLTGKQSLVEVRSIIAVKGAVTESRFQRSTPPLTNRALFRRDGHLCLYCGEQFPESKLTRDHVKPQCQRGEDVWGNVVAACPHCNHRKGGRTPEQANMRLLAVPYIPNFAEWLILSNRQILVDQMDFLIPRVGKASRLVI